ncbi:PREDICTED: formin-binding protein 1-like [Nicrophorus vespilloides]|uniref:Formin-binding protein 1-like n=1 Tax=Nicrophorus vespilloides TaxID=110193 RepID=A0ABM1N6P8_NICVS|nr:PREDICTED: formin-binding protein 1-like [Nicrophorus vespilloides]
MVMNETNDLAGQRELVAENMQSNVLKELNALIKINREDRKKHLLEGAKLQQNLHNQVDVMGRSKKAYEKAFKEAEKAVDNFQKADADYNLSRAEVDKQRVNMTMKSQICETAKNDYADQLQRTNEMQRQHYRSGLPDVFRQLQDLDEKRIKNIKNFINSSAEIERNVFPIINSCLDGIVRAGNMINEKEDTLLVIERYKSGFCPPEDFPFEDLSKGGSDSGGSTPMINSIQAEAKPRSGGLTMKGTMSGKGLKKRTGLFHIFTSKGKLTEMCMAIKYAAVADGKDDYSELPPNQRLKKLRVRVEELQAKVKSESAARDGLMKMKGVYEDNPALGDPMTIEGQLNESSHKLEKLQAEQKRFLGYLEEAQRSTQQLNNSQTNSPRSENGSRNNHLHHHHRHSAGSAAEEESLSRSASDSSVTNPTLNHNKQPSAPGTPQLNHGPESGLGTSHTSLPGADSDQDHEQDPHDPDHDQYDGTAGSEFYDDIYSVEYQPLGVCKAIYPFEATSEGSIPMAENEELHLIESDQGDGWTRVRRMNSAEEGFVPTSYIGITIFNT